MRLGISLALSGVLRLVAVIRTGSLLLETGDYLLLETGDKLLLD